MVDVLSDEQAGQLLKAIFAHEDGEDAMLEGALRGIFVLVANQMDRDRLKYEESCARNRENGAKGGRPSKRGGNPAEPTAGHTPPKKADTDTRAVSGGKPRTHTRLSGSTQFKKPTAEAVQAYCTQRGNSVDVSRFMDFYDSKGWRVGTSPMKDWQAAVRGWEKDARAAPTAAAASGKPPKQQKYCEVI